MSAAVPINPDGTLDWTGTNGSIGAPIKVLPGVGLGLAVGAGVQYSSTQLTPTLLKTCSFQLTVNTSVLLVPPLVQPKLPEFPPGVNTFTFTGPGSEMMPVVSITFSC